jgi:xylulose-5-phosphate/fructose-6-phosphate phosphoketolase
VPDSMSDPPDGPAPGGLADDELELIDAWWRAANYLTVGQIYLQSNPLLHHPLATEHIKPRLLGHWGTSPGLNLLYAHLNRVIVRDDLDMIYVTGPGHGGPALLANVYLEGSYGEFYPAVSCDTVGMQRLFRQFSTPGGIPSHVSVTTPGSIHEGGELGYALAHAFGAAFDNPGLIVACVVGDGEAETGPLEGSWKGIRFLNPARDGAVLPILHLNGYKISGPTVLGRASHDDVREMLEGHGYEVHVVAGDEPDAVHRRLAEVLDTCLGRIRQIQDEARSGTEVRLPRWPMIVLATPKGWTGPKVVDGVKIEGTFRAHQVPLSGVRDNPDHLHQLEDWMRSYRPEELFDENGRLVSRLAGLAPVGDRRMGANPQANGGRHPHHLRLPDWAGYAVDVQAPAAVYVESTRRLGEMLRDIYRLNADEADFRLFCPDETNSNRLGAVFEETDRCLVERTATDDDHVSPDGRVMEVLSEHLCHGWLEGYTLTGRHGLFATYEAFAMVSASMTVQHTKWLEHSRDLAWRRPIPSLNILLTSTCWRNDHNGFSHQGPGLIDTVVTKRGSVARVYLPPDANCLLSVADHCLRSHDYVNLIVIDKQPQLQYLTIEQARQHCSRGIGTWDWAGTENRAGSEDQTGTGTSGDQRLDVVLACAGDIPTMEMLAAAAMLRKGVPTLRFRFVNVVDLMKLMPANDHPHGMSHGEFVEQFTPDTHVVFAFHGYPGAVHGLIHGQADADRFHVRGYREQGTTTTPFDMVVLNQTSRYHLVAEALRRSRRIPDGATDLARHCDEMLQRHHAYVREHLEDMPEVVDWTWNP